MPQQSLPDAVVYGQTAVVQALIEGGADVNAPDDTGLTPLALAAMQGQTAIARLLIAAKADVNRRLERRHHAADARGVGRITATPCGC